MVTFKSENNYFNENMIRTAGLMNYNYKFSQTTYSHKSRFEIMFKGIEPYIF